MIQVVIMKIGLLGYLVLLLVCDLWEVLQFMVCLCARIWVYVIIFVSLYRQYCSILHLSLHGFVSRPDQVQ